MKPLREFRPNGVGTVPTGGLGRYDSCIQDSDATGTPMALEDAAAVPVTRVAEAMGVQVE